MTVDDLLRQQHVEMRRLLAELRDADHERVAIDLDALDDAVKLHWTLEARHLHPLLGELGYPDSRRAIKAQRALRNVVADVRELWAAGAPFHCALEELSAALEEHIADEERTVLPFLAAHAPPDRLDAATNEMLATIAEIENENWLGALPASINV